MKPSMRAEYKNVPPRYKYSPTYQDDPRSTEELIGLALTERDEDEAWEYIWILQRRDTPEVLEAARRLCRSDFAEERALGADILGQLRLKDSTACEVAVTVLLELLAHEDHPRVLNSAAVALGHRDDPRAIPLLVQLKNDLDSDVRYGVVHACWGMRMLKLSPR